MCSHEGCRHQDRLNNGSLRAKGSGQTCRAGFRRALQDHTQTSGLGFGNLGPGLRSPLISG